MKKAIVFLAITFSVIFNLFSQGKQTRKITIPANKQATEVIKDSIFAPFVNGTNNYILPDDTTVICILDKKDYGIYKYGRNKSSHATSNYHILYQIGNELVYSSDISSKRWHKRMTRRFFHTLKKEDIQFTPEEKKSVSERINKLIRTNNMKAFSDVF